MRRGRFRNRGCRGLEIFDRQGFGSGNHGNVRLLRRGRYNGGLGARGLDFGGLTVAGRPGTTMAGEGFARQHSAAIPVGGHFDHGGWFETAAARRCGASAGRGTRRRFRLARSRLASAAVFRKRFAGKNNGEILRGHAAGRAALGTRDGFGRGRFLDDLGGFERALLGAGAASAETAAAAAVPAANAAFSALLATILTAV